MRLRELLLEYDRSKTIAAYWSKLFPMLRKDNYAITLMSEFEYRHPTYNVEYPEEYEYQALVMPWFENADPTPNKSVVRWIIAMYTHKMFNSIEDLGRVRNAIEIIERLKKSGYFRRHPEKENIGDYSKIWGLLYWEGYINQIDPIEYESEAERARKHAALMAGEEQADILLNSNRWKIVVPKTALAASFYGKNTKWCTTSENGDMFDYYNEMGPLVVILDKPNNRRWQFHFQRGQYMDERDLPIDPVKFISTNPEIKKALVSVMDDITKVGFEFGHPHMTIKSFTNDSYHSIILPKVYPDYLTVEGNLDLHRDQNITSLGTGTIVKGNLGLKGADNLKQLPQGLRVDGYLEISYCENLVGLPEGLTVGKFIHMQAVKFDTLPRNLSVSGDVVATACSRKLIAALKAHPGIKGSIIH